jgi:hypothetical protein
MKEDHYSDGFAATTLHDMAARSQDGYGYSNDVWLGMGAPYSDLESGRHDNVNGDDDDDGDDYDGWR